MATIKVEVISNKKEMNDFIQLPYHIYKDCPQYVPDLESDIRDLLNPKKNSAFKFSHIKPFVAYKDGVAVGRIVGLINKKANEHWKRKNVRFSLIEFIDDQEVSAALIEAVMKWGKSHGMETIQGPMGITDFDKEGMLVEDFHLTGTMNTIYNPAYYPRHMEALGFEKEVDWVQIRINIPEEVPARYARTAQYVREQIGLKVIKLTNKDIYKRGYGKKVFRLLNEAYKNIFGFSSLSEAQVDEFMDKYLKLIDKQLIPVVVNQQQEVVGVAITMGCLSHAMQKAHGRLWPLGWWPLLKAMFLKHDDMTELLLVGVHPDYQNSGVNSLVFMDMFRKYNEMGIRVAETNAILETNLKNQGQFRDFEHECKKRRRSYIKKLD